MFKASYRKKCNAWWVDPANLGQLSASQKRILMTKWIRDVFAECLSKVNPSEGFKKLGYMYADDASYTPRIRDLDYAFDPQLVPLPHPLVPAKPAPASQASCQAFAAGICE